MHHEFLREDYTSLLLSLLDLNRKWIPAHKRKVIYSKELRDKIENKKIKQRHIDLIHDFEDKFVNGENINGHLSKNIYSPSSLDKLLLYWKIHHLHLNKRSATRFNQMYCNRSEYYLLFLIDKYNAYFLDITPHLKGSEFSSFDFLEIIFNNNWESLIPFVVLPNVIGVSSEITDKEQLNQIWNANINYLFYNYNGKYYGNVSSVMLNGNSLEDMSCICDLNKKLFDISNHHNVILKDVKVMADNCILKIEVSIDTVDQTIEIHNNIQNNIFEL